MEVPAAQGAVLTDARRRPHPEIGSLSAAAVEMLSVAAPRSSAVVVQREGPTWRALAASPGDLGITAGEIVHAAERPWIRRIVAALADHPSLAGEPIAAPDMRVDDDIRTTIVAPIALSDGLLVGAVALMDRRPLPSASVAASSLVTGVVRFLATAYDSVWERGEVAAGLHVAEEVADRQHQLITSIAHDFRTPLTVISGMAEVITGHAHDPERAHGAATTIGANARRLAAMIDGLIEAEAREFGELSEDAVEIDLADFLSEVASEAEQLISRHGVGLECVASGRVRAPALTLRRLLLNLLANAIRVTSEGTIKLTAEPRGRDLVIAVEDTGVGMRPDEISAMTEAYRRGGDSSGFGLGLAIVHRLARVLGAEMETRSTPGEGTCFRLLLPRAIVSPTMAG